MNTPSFEMSKRAIRNIVPLALVMVLGAAVSACVYRVDVQQGNEITTDMISKLNPGMTRREVVKILGYPLVSDPFNRNRWDYFYSYKSGKTREMTRRSAKLLFEGDYLTSVESDITPKAENADTRE